MLEKQAFAKSEDFALYKACKKLQRATKPNRISASSEGATWAQRGAAAVAASDLPTARKAFVSAVKRDSGNANYRYHLAVLLQASGQRAEAAEHLTVALRLDPTLQKAGQRLGEILAHGVLGDKHRLDDVGLIAAISFDTVERDLLCAAALHQLAKSHPLRNALEHGRREGWDNVARKLCGEKTHDLLKQPLFLTVLESGTVCRFDVECLLAAIRRVIFLELPRTRLQDAALCRFAVALLRQCWLNEFVWLETGTEKDKVDTETISLVDIQSGDISASQRFLLQCLYRPVLATKGCAARSGDLSLIEPAVFRDALADHIAEAAEIRERGNRMASFSALADDVSHKVASQYEASPYPRWTSVPIYPKSGYIEHLKQHFKLGQLAFSEKPFEVLVAGCGTGRQAVSAAFDYGPNAAVLGFDITRASLGYASLMADRMGAKNLQLAHGDLNRILDFEPAFRDRFHIIECGGVLHHLADPFAAWQNLIQCLAPGGIILIGLYSQTARRNLQVLRAEPAYPGAGAGDDALRAYRAALLSRGGQWPGHEFMRGKDVYSSSGFRDFFLHVNEHTTTLPVIKQFLSANGLEFRGFMDIPVDALRRLHPEAESPGDLSQWDEWEQQHPHAFAGMYQFWCTKA